MIVYRGGGVLLYRGDCRQILTGPDALPWLDDVNHVITDPPYDTETHAGSRSFGETSSRIDFAPLVDLSWLSLLPKQARWRLAFCGMEMLGDYRRQAGESWVRAGFWHRTDGAPQFTGDRPAQPGEGIAIWHPPGKKIWNGGGSRAFYSYGVVRGGQRVHPTQKPEPLLLELIEQFTNPGDLILDPFAGSGTLGVAARRLGRRALLIEIDPAYCDMAIRRLAQASLFQEQEV